LSMETYIAILRGINVSGQKSIKMADLKTHLEEMGYHKVETYIQSGNVVFDHETSPPQDLAKDIEEKIFEKYGFQVPTIVKLPSELEHTLGHNPFLQDPRKDPNRMYVTFLSEAPSSISMAKVENIDHSPEEFVLDGANIYLFAPLGYGRAKMNNNFFENKLKVAATTRNWKTVNKLAEMAKER